MKRARAERSPDEAVQGGADEDRRRGAMTLGLIGWGVVFGIVFAYQALCLVRSGDGWPAFSDLVRIITRNAVGRWVLFGAWLWFGWHLFIRGWRFFLRS